MNDKNYIQVILPLKLDWEPFYSLPEGFSVQKGDRVRVLFSGGEYIAVVSKINVSPDDSLREKEIFEILEAVDYLPRITEREMKFWDLLSRYYLCTVGEVFKACYQVDKKAPKKWMYGKDRATVSGELVLEPAEESCSNSIARAFSSRKTVLLRGDNESARRAVYLKLAADTLKKGKSVLYLVPEIALTSSLLESVTAVFPELMLYHSQVSPTKKRDVVLAAREGAPIVVLGTRSSLFIPFKDIGLIIVDQEHDSSYKQDSPAPRYNARDCAIFLASTYGANVLLGSATPSLESIYNSDIGLFKCVELKDNFRSSNSPVMLVDTIAEKKKRGIVGSFSLKLLEELERLNHTENKVLIVCTSKASIAEYKEELENRFPAAAQMDISYASLFAVKNMPCGMYNLICILQADSMLSREDFRSDERTLQLLHRLSSGPGMLLVQTKESSHPVFSALTDSSLYPSEMMLKERSVIGYPPFTRLVDICVKDSDQARINLRARLLASRIREAIMPIQEPKIIGPCQTASQESSTEMYQRLIRVTFGRDKLLSASKEALYKSITEFESIYNYSGHITIDVDPA